MGNTTTFRVEMEIACGTSGDTQKMSFQHAGGDHSSRVLEVGMGISRCVQPMLDSDCEVLEALASAVELFANKPGDVHLDEGDSIPEADAFIEAAVNFINARMATRPKSKRKNPKPSA